MIEVPLGIAIALCIPRSGWLVGLTLVVVALPMLIPWNVVGTMWQIFTRADIGLFGAALTGARPALQRDPGFDFRLDHDRRHRRLALDAARHSAELRGSPGNSRRLLSGRPNRRREPLGDFLQHRIAEAAKGARHRGAAALHADVHDLHRAVRRDRRRPGQRDDLPVDRSGQDRAWARSTSATPPRCRSSII